MDKTIRPGFNKKRTQAVSKKDLANANIPRPGGTVDTKTQVMETLPPSVYLVNGHTSVDFPIDPNELVISVGKSPDATITLNDESLSPVHFMIVKLKNECLFLDRGKRDIVEFDGIKSRQACKPTNSRLTVKLGNHWLIYDAYDIKQKSQKTESPDTAQVTLKYKNRSFSSSKDSLLIGTHQSCDIRLHTKTVAEFAAIVYWNKNGVFIDKMGASRAAVCLNRKRVMEATKINDGDEISMGQDRIDISIEGDVDKRAHGLFAQIEERPTLAITALNSPEPFTTPLIVNNNYTVGRSSTADFQFEEPSVSRIHAKLMVREKFLTVTDNESFNKVKVNMEEVPKASVFAGDIIELGSLALLIHYNSVRY